MTYRSLLVHVDDAERCSHRLDVASRMARDFGAVLVGAYLVQTRELVPSISAMLPDSIVRQRLQETGDAQARAEASFRAAAAAAGLTTIEWRAPAGNPIEAAVAHARGVDLVVIGQPDPDDPDSAFAADLANAVILSTGRPTLVIPYVGAAGATGETVLVAWDGSRESVRAIADALPLLARAAKVVVMSITAGGEARPSDVQARVQIVAYLSQHGIIATARHLELPDVAMGELLLSEAADVGADLIVMGAYGHARLQELVLGGVTRTMLEAMTVPVLMSH